MIPWGISIAVVDNVISHLQNVNTKYTLWTNNTKYKTSQVLTESAPVATDGFMKDKILHMRFDSEYEQMLSDLRKAEDDLPDKSKMIRRLIERAHKDLKKGKK
jgi:hypothetical protein